MSVQPKYRPHSVACETRPDGTMLLTSKYPMGPVAEKSGEWLHQWSKDSPDQVFLAERSGAGWRSENYAASLEKVRALAASLLARGMGPDTPIIILSGNGVDNGLLTLAAQYVGVPTVPVAEQYSLIPAAHGRLQHVIDMVKPTMAYVVDAKQYSKALEMDAMKGIKIVASRSAGMSNVTTIDDMLKGDSSVDLVGAYANVTADCVAKILMTSGSTSAPKGVPTTQRMMCANQSQIGDSLPFVRARPPVLVDWLPWNHVFGGSHNFNLVLANGGSLYVDEGKPVKGLFDRTIENLKLQTGSIVFNVPVGFGMLLSALKADASLRQRFFEDLDMIFYAGASLPQEIWKGFEEMARNVSGQVPLLTSSWGLTETAPAAVSQHEPTDRAGVIGVPLPGTTLKLIPDSDGRCEARVKGPNIMTGYLGNPEKTKEAFDDEGYFITDDAMLFVDPDDINKGMKFDGRISEDFKLLTGTWVHASNLRASILAAFAPLASDVVITGQDRNEIGVLIFPNREELAKAGYADDVENGLFVCPNLLAEIKRRLSDHAALAAGSSMRVARAVVLAELPSLTDGEITAKGNLNFRKIQSRRAEILGRLYDDMAPSVAKL